MPLVTTAPVDVSPESYHPTQEDRFAMAMRSLITAYRKGPAISRRMDIERTAGWFQVGADRLKRTFESWVAAEIASAVEEGVSA